MNAKPKIETDEDPWENRGLGADENFVQVAEDVGDEIDSALGLRPISIRLQQSLIDNLKALATLNGLGYQPLIRQVLTRWVDGEVKRMVSARQEEAREPKHCVVPDDDSGHQRTRRKAA